ncbi:hypothetical protein [Clostridioides difficile]|uniref:hypothetical protein n=1 Tax=Clostridioides difficile TaxID=1496 RepID=UPI001F3DD31D|nr:hypothetical protein [Clostridioides difficile]
MAKDEIIKQGLTYYVNYVIDGIDLENVIDGITLQSLDDVPIYITFSSRFIIFRAQI